MLQNPCSKGVSRGGLPQVPVGLILGVPQFAFPLSIAQEYTVAKGPSVFCNESEGPNRIALTVGKTAEPDESVKERGGLGAVSQMEL